MRHVVNPGQDPHQDAPEEPSTGLAPGESFYYGFRPDAGVYDVKAVEGDSYVATSPVLPDWEFLIPRALVSRVVRKNAV